MSRIQVFEFIDAEETSFPIAFMCRRLGVSKAGYFAWKHRYVSQRAVADARITKLIHQIHAGSRGTYGAQRIRAELADKYGVHFGRKRIARLMRIAQLRGVCRRRRVRTTRRDDQAELSDDPGRLPLGRNYARRDGAHRRVVHANARRSPVLGSLPSRSCHGSCSCLRSSAALWRPMCSW